MAEINFRDYEERDFANIVRIWKECGWIEGDMDSTMKDIIGECRIRVGEVDGAVESSAMATDGRLHYQQETMKTNIINAVTVSLVARKAGLAKRALAGLLATEAEAGIPFSVLGIFEQGFYDKLGYGSGNYYRQLQVDPAELDVKIKCGIPKRLTIKDVDAVHENRLSRYSLHGHVEMLSRIATKSEMEICKKSFGLGYYDESGRLTHHIWINPKGENGPFRIMWNAYETGEQFVELLALMQSFNNQVRQISITEPADIQLTDFMKKPIHKKAVTAGGKYSNSMNAYIFWQFRILDIAECLRKTSLNIENLVFNLELNDPIEKYIDAESKWQGCGGEYFVKLGIKSEVSKGYREGYPLLKAGIGAFSRMWLGVRPASGLAISDDLAADKELLSKLDKAFCLPEPQPDWWF